MRQDGTGGTTLMPRDEKPLDLFIIGGGINGCGIARDAAGRGLAVRLTEMNDLASATSSASTKLFHGGLRYLEYFEFRLVREALIERETLLRAMPHISWPMRFVLPLHKDMRFDNTTPTSRLLTFVMPWMKGRRPNWLIRLGLFLYDNLGGRQILPGTKVCNLGTGLEGKPLQDKYRQAYEYSDCWVQDARLVVLNARDAQAKGADIRTRTKVLEARQENGLWRIVTEAEGQTEVHSARMLINAGGPWVGDIIKDVMSKNAKDSVRLVRGSHIVTKRLYDHDKCYFFQGSDGRIIFAIPYEQDFTLIGTTDAAHDRADVKPEASPEEQAYLLDFANTYFKSQLTQDDVVWTYSGVRPLYDDGAASASAATRDYVLKLETTGAPALHVFGGKITTYRRLAESALDKVAEALGPVGPEWTAGAPLPGGDFPVEDVSKQMTHLSKKYPFLDQKRIERMFRCYGTECFDILGNASREQDLGTHFGAGLYEAELRWLASNEYARTAADVLWRRTKLGLRLSRDEAAKVEQWFAAQCAYNML